MDTSKLKMESRNLLNVRKGRARHKVIRERIIDGASIDGIHLCQLIAAMTICCIGLNMDSTEAVIGAMLICPIMGSVLAIAYGVATIDTRMLKDTMVCLLAQVLVCLCTSTLYFSISPLSHATSELLTNSSATVWDVLIAFVGGFAGALGLSRKQEPSTLIAGVAVATALMPPLCSTGYGVSIRDFGLAFGALYEFFINVVFIAFGAELVMVWLRVPLQSDLDGDGVVTVQEQEEAVAWSRKLRVRLVVLSLLFAIPCLFFSYKLIRDTMMQNGTLFSAGDTYEVEDTTKMLNVVCPEFVSYRIGPQDSYRIEEDSVDEKLVATIETSSELDEERKKQLTELVEVNTESVEEVEFVVSDDRPVSEK